MRRKILTGIIIFTALIFAGSAYSDFGSFSGNSDYDSGSRSSSSSSSSRSSSSSSSSTSRPSRSYSTGTTTRRTTPSYNTNTGGGGGSNFGVIPLASGIARQNNSYDDDEEMTDEEFSECMGVLFVLTVFFIFWMIIRSKNKKRQQEHAHINIDQPARILRPMEEYLELDPEFDEERIKTLMSNLYVQMQDTWHAKDISSLRPYMTDAFFAQMDRQLEQFRKTGRTDFTENIAVLNVGLKGWRQSAGKDYITVSLTSRIVSYVLDDVTGKLLSGDKNREKFMEYEIELTRKSGEITSAEAEGTRSERCPHCGAPLKLNASAQCEYCGSVITSVNSDWAICGMRGISQRTI
ncbi:MAG: TIM44-like domain-containing protein [Synergistaceae bacterium]|nr:TIM44-like domain-containing protein [Synergistaceae bacterium]